jgi:hypothetical protein
VGPAALLQICHVAGFSGTLAIHSSSRPLEVAFREGEIVGAHSERRRGMEAIIELLRWDRGYFEFHGGEAVEGEALGQTFDQLLLEACRRLDETQRGGGG